jgi:transcriptional regulator with GAF, ATPase, and Fis domain
MERVMTTEEQAVFVLRIQEPAKSPRLMRVGSSVVIGRSKKCDIVLDDPRISLKHVEISFDGGAVRAKDLSSTNGTFVTRLDREGLSEPQRLDTGMPTALRHGDELRLGDASGPYKVVLELEPVVLDEILGDDDPTPPPPATLARLLARVDVEGVIEALAGITFETFAEVENVIVWGPGGDEPIYAARRTPTAFARLPHAPPFSRTVIGRVRAGGGTIVFGTPLPQAIDSESLRHAQILAGFCAPLLDARGQVVGVLEADSRRRHWSPAETTLREVSRLACFAGRVSAVALEAEASKRRADTLAREGERLRRELGVRAGLVGIVGRDPRLVEQLDLLDRIAPLDAPALIVGETGTGKELFARALHERSARAPKPFVAINCASLPESLLESELFGYERGAFTGAERATPGLFERAAGGTLFLDEIGEASLDLQAALLRAIERKEIRRLGASAPRSVDIRIVAATNRDLETEVNEGRFRRDLLFRMNALTIKIPALRERRGDIPDLAAHFMADLRARLGRPELRLSPEALRLLVDDGWTGNVRELENRLLRAAVLADDGLILANHVGRPDWTPPPTSGATTKLGAGQIAPLRDARDSFLRLHVTRALEIAKGNRREAARLLCTDASNLARTMRRLGMLAKGVGDDDGDDDED